MREVGVIDPPLIDQNANTGTYGRKLGLSALFGFQDNEGRLYKRALEIRGEVKGLKGQWLLRDQNDPDAGYSISQWDNEEDMRAFWDSPKRREAMSVLQPFFVNQFTITHCTVQVASSY